jgi:hypothetical protein
MHAAQVADYYDPLLSDLFHRNVRLMSAGSARRCGMIPGG